MTHWIITKDLIEKGAAVGIRSHSFSKETEATAVHRFRMLDGDNMVYFEGLSNKHDDESAFAPLDDFGKPSSGCVSIEFFENERWREL
jgi:hypothetical protein